MVFIRLGIDRGAVHHRRRHLPLLGLLSSPPFPSVRRFLVLSFRQRFHIRRRFYAAHFRVTAARLSRRRRHRVEKDLDNFEEMEKVGRQRG